MCSLSSWHYWSLFLWKRGVAYSHCACRAAQSRAANFSAQSYVLVSKICCGSNKMEQLLTQHTFQCKSSGQCFQAASFLVPGTSPVPPVSLTSQGATLKAGYAEHVLPILLTQNSEFLSVFKGPPRKCYNMLTAFPLRLHECIEWHGRRIQTVVAEVNSYGHGMHPIVLIKFFLFSLKINLI